MIRTVSNNCQLFTLSSCTPNVDPSSFQFFFRVLNRTKTLEMGKNPFRRERLTKEKASFKFFVTNSRCIWIPTVERPHLFAGPETLCRISNSETNLREFEFRYQHSGCAVLLHEARISKSRNTEFVVEIQSWWNETLTLIGIFLPRSSVVFIVTFQNKIL